MILDGLLQFTSSTGGGTGNGDSPTAIGSTASANQLDLQAMNKTNVLLRLEEFDGKPITTFRGIPVRTVDAIVNNETNVV